jgi:hypothetical protein
VTISKQSLDLIKVQEKRSERTRTVAIMYCNDSEESTSGEANEDDLRHIAIRGPEVLTMRLRRQAPGCVRVSKLPWHLSM